IGRKNIAIVSIIPTLIIILYSVMLFKMNMISLNIFIAFTLAISFPLAIIIVYILRKSETKRFANASSLMKINMLMLLIILWVG
ncbi:MAG: hypothetical protein P9L95_01510, partial [Candidatus Tenebribacter mawsonii]|nr:hypothetical protein [Candidatus Tenebribacter mawsonii]